MPAPESPANSRYDSSYTRIATFNSATDVNQFCNKYNNANTYENLKLGQCIKINDGTYNSDWYIAGFDCEYKNKASDGNIKSNGYGICLIGYLNNGNWNDSTNMIPYINSSIRNNKLASAGNNFKSILGNHLVNRNVLLSSSMNTSGSTAYTWTTDYFTLLSIGQVKGAFGSYNNKYDDGEANYKLPLFNFLQYNGLGYSVSRNIKGYINGAMYIWLFWQHGGITDDRTYYFGGPYNHHYAMIYIR